MSASNVYSTQFKELKEECERLPLDFPTHNSDKYNEVYSLSELDWALSRVKGQACGVDDIGYPMLKHLPIAAKCLLLQVYNDIWMGGTIPSVWKTGIVIPLPKSKEKTSSVSGYRPITLLSCVGKVMEKMVNRRLTEALEREKLLDERQFGFRSGRGVESYLVELEVCLHKHFKPSHVSTCALLDITKAYDQVWRRHILATLANWGFAGRMMAYLASFLTDRTFKVAVGDRFSSEKIAENGVPQGAILSVTLFLVAMNSIFDFIPDGVKVILYADDILLISSGLVQRSRNRLQSAVKSVSMWADEVGFTISSEKSSILSIRRRARGAQRAPIFMNGKAIPEGFNSTLLGVTIDRNLNFKLNAKLVKKKIADHLNVLKAIKGRLKGSPRDSLLNIFKSWIIPRLVYGIILASKADKYFKMLESAYNSGIRIITGAFYSSPIKSLLAEIGEPPFEMVCVQRMIHALVRWEECPANLSLDTPYGVRARQKYQTLTGEILPRPMRLSRCSPRAWDAVPPSISWRVKRFVRAGDNPQKVQAVVNEALRTDFANKRIVYTDGSVTDDASAIGILDCNAKTSMRVPNEFSIFSCEALAIKLALESVTNADSVVVCSDSASVLKAVEGGTIKHPIIQEIEEQLRGSSAILCWIPGHTGIPGNEEADRLANEGRRGSITSMGIPGKDLIRRANNSILLTWEAEWNRERDLQFRRIKASTGKWRDRANTYEQRILSRLRIGHTWLTHNFLAKKEEPPTCCGTRLTVGHILTECMRTADLRRRYGLTGGLDVVLQNDTRKERDTLDFLKEANLIQYI